MKENLNAEECAENAEDAKTTGNVDAEAREADEKQEEPEKEMTSGEEAACDAEEASEEASTGDKDKKGFKFFKKDKKDERDEKIAELTDRLQRNMAEFDNFRKRTEKEKAQMFDMGAKNVIEKILPVVDNFERALGSLSEEEREASFAKGVDGIYRQIEKLFEDLDVKPIEALGQKFDPNLHNAVMTDEDSDAEEDTITMDLQKGYTFRGQVVRHSMVKVKK
ncbi:MAG: nucleotide exchange factor GrpE [Bacillota bacterium]|nr:nucleotide exchange factor GrpE [Bacillota bacterium]